ncbi:MAG: DUF58 domain-containing protein [Deltaproteobacteria bacterium]|nr:DUF58 domain-containing protein [Deltaproteobacteria bacterium]
MRPTRLAVLAFASGGALAVLCAAVQPALWPFWLAFLFLAAISLMADWALGPRLARLRVSVELPEQLLVGSECEARLRIENPGRRQLRLRLHVDTSGDFEQVPELADVRIPPGTAETAFGLRALRRGRSTIEAVWLECIGPLGLLAFRRRCFLGVTRPVTPDVHSVSRAAIQLFSSRNLQHGVRVERYRGDGSEFDCLREYEPGFDIRTIDWKASARLARLLCRELRAERNRQIMLAVDSGRLMSEPVGEARTATPLPRLDYAIHAGLLLAYISLHVGDRVGLLSFDDRVRHYCTPVRGQAAFGSLSRLASQIDYSSRESNFTLGLMELARRQSRRALVVVLTDFVDTISAELMVENLSRLARRHLLIFVALQDPLLLLEGKQRPEDLVQLHRAVVAHRLLQDREMVIRRLRRMGILCVDAPPEQISTRLIDHYLNLKRKEAF